MIGYLIVVYVVIVVSMGAILTHDAVSFVKTGERKIEWLMDMLYLVFAFLTVGLGIAYLEVIEEKLKQKYWEPCPIIGKPCEFYRENECKWKNYGYGCFKEDVEPKLEELDIVLFFGLMGLFGLLWVIMLMV